MAAAAFEIRVCQNPDCGLRYPLKDQDSFGDRCPVCLSQTIVAAEKRLEREPIFDNPTTAANAGMQVLLDNIRSAWNVGSILRSADGFDFRHAYLCGITPTPDVPEVRKTALGAENYVAWSAHKNALELACQLKKQQIQIWALEQTHNSIPIDQAVLPQVHLAQSILVVGNEVTGVDPGILEIADKVVHLPMRGHKRSFNVAMAFAVAAQIMCSRSVLRE